MGTRPFGGSTTSDEFFVSFRSLRSVQEARPGAAARAIQISGIELGLSLLSGTSNGVLV